MRGHELGLPHAGFVGCVVGLGSCRFAVTLAFIPPFDEIAAFGVGFVSAVDPDMVTAHSAFAVEESGGEYPAVVAFDLLEKLYARQIGHTDGFWEEPPIGLPISSVTSR